MTYPSDLNRCLAVQQKLPPVITGAILDFIEWYAQRTREGGTTLHTREAMTTAFRVWAHARGLDTDTIRHAWTLALDITPAQVPSPRSVMLGAHELPEDRPRVDDWMSP